MREIDLIPASYRDYLTNIYYFKMTLFCAATLGFLLIAPFIVTLLNNQSLEHQIEQVMAKRMSLDDKINQRTSLEEQRNLYQNQLDLVNVFSNPPTTDKVFSLLEDSLPRTGIHFTALTFKHDQQPHNPQQKDQIEHAVVVNIIDTESQKPFAFSVAALIQGQAKNYKILSDFVRRLSEHDMVAGADITNTTRVNQAQGSGLKFTINVYYHSEAKLS